MATLGCRNRSGLSGINRALFSLTKNMLTVTGGPSAVTGQPPVVNYQLLAATH